MASFPLRGLFGMALAFAASTVAASPPGHATQAPGFYRLRLGQATVTALLDGTHPFDAQKLLVGIDPSQIDALLAYQYLSSPVEGSINAFLIDTGSRLCSSTRVPARCTEPTAVSSSLI